MEMIKSSQNWYCWVVMSVWFSPPLRSSMRKPVKNSEPTKSEKFVSRALSRWKNIWRDPRWSPKFSPSFSIRVLVLVTRFRWVFFTFWSSQATAATIKDGYIHTGDKGYYDNDGYLFVIGRYKELIKYRMSHVMSLKSESNGEMMLQVGAFLTRKGRPVQHWEADDDAPGRGGGGGGGRPRRRGRRATDGLRGAETGRQRHRRGTRQLHQR